MGTTVHRSGRAPAVAAALGATATLALAGVAAWLRAMGDAPGSLRALALTAVFVVPGGIIAALRPRLPLGWLALGVAVLFAAAGLGEQWARHASAAGGADVAWAAWVTDRFAALLAVGVWLMLMLLPEGRLPGPAWRPVVGGVVGVQLLVLFAFVTVQGPVGSMDSSLPPEVAALANPAGLLPAGLAPRLEGIDAVVLQLPLLLAPVAYVLRLRRAGVDERARIVVVLLAASTFVLVAVLGDALWPQATDALDVLAAGLLAAVLTATVLGRQPRVVAGLVRQAFVYTVLLALIGALAVLVVGVLRAAGHSFEGFGIAVVAAGLALALHPVRRRLTAGVDRLLFGDAHDPYRALQRLAETTHRAPTAGAVLQGLAGTAAASLRLSWAAAEAGGATGAVGTRATGAADVRVDLLSGTVPVGSLTVAVGPGRRLSTEECRLLADLGRHGGVAVQAVLLTDELRAGRAALVLTREEERRRLRRDLHDDVGPTLAGLTMQLGVLRTLVHTEPDEAADRLGLLQAAARRALESVRRVVHGLRPPALDDLGLVGALRQLADSLGLCVTFPDDDPPRLPAAVEVAGYRIGAEALHNVARHAGADQVEVSVRVEGGELVLRVRDDGTGIDPDRTAGVGSIAMQERVDELGGSLEVASTSSGTTVEARLPTLVGRPEVVA